MSLGSLLNKGKEAITNVANSAAQKYNDYKEAFRYGLCTGSASAFKEELATLEDVEKLYATLKGE